MMWSDGLLMNRNCLLIADPWGKLKMLRECGHQALEVASDHRPSNADTVARGWTSPGLGHALPSSAGFWRDQAPGSLRPAPPPCGCCSLCFALFSGAGPLCRGDREDVLNLPGPEQRALSPWAWTERAEGGPREQAASAPWQRDHRAPASDGSCSSEKARDTSAHGHTDTHTQAVSISPLFVDLCQGHWGFSSSRHQGQW